MGEIQNFQCLICGKKADDKHHTKPKKFGGTHTIPLCKKHHHYIENIKTAIFVMEREKKVSIRRFRQIIDEIKINQRKKDGLE